MMKEAQVPLVEYHAAIAAAVEAERKACEERLRELARHWRRRGMLVAADFYDESADAIAAREKSGSR